PELLAGEHGSAADPVPPSGRPIEDDRIPGPARAGPCDTLGRKKPDAHRVDQTVASVHLIEDRLSADRGDSNAVPVVADARNGSPEAPAVGAEAQPLGQRDRPPAHRAEVTPAPATPR